jgi:tight adherence protein B
MDLIARALKAGHALSGGLQLVGEEFGDPIGTEFERTVNEINFGVAVPEALKALARRVDCNDLKFFVMSVIIQRETGGNLAEILENIARLIRERFKLHGRIRVLSAEGKLSAIILVAIPFFLGFVLSIINPEYINTLFEDPIGIVLVIFACVMMAFGILMMKKMVAIRV